MNDSKHYISRQAADKINKWMSENCDEVSMIEFGKAYIYIDSLVSEECPVCGSGCCLNEEHDKEEKDGR